MTGSGRSTRVGTPASKTRIFIAVFVIGVFFNYAWELAQAPLFAGTDRQNIWWHCFIASLGDGLILLLIAVIGWATQRRFDWFLRPGISAYAVMLISGALIAVLIEWVAVHLAQRWSYLPAMPLLPWLDIGLIPVAQMLLLPPLTFRVASAWIARRPSVRN